MAVPAVLVMSIQLSGLQLPVPALYAIAAVLGIMLFVRSMRDPEWLIAIFILYIPLNRLYVVPIAPGINGTNALLTLLLLTWLVRSAAERKPMFKSYPGIRLVTWWAMFSGISIVTTGYTLGFGFAALENLPFIKAWFDQFVVFFSFVNLIRDKDMARRIVIYMMIGAVVVILFGIEEWLRKRGLDRIEKARLLGPQLQPNDFGAFLVYSAGPFIAVAVTHPFKPKAWLLVMPYFALLARVLLATFSRGAYLAIGAAVTVAAYLRGKVFVASVTAASLGLLAVFPELIPDSLVARMNNPLAEETGETLDQSSQTRLILWNAAIDMTLESPILGKGFGTFPYLKSFYTLVDVPEKDNHNMFLYIASQMGLPALLVFLLILARIAMIGISLNRWSRDSFTQLVGMGGVSMVAGVFVVNMFGSRMVDLTVMGYFWINFAVLSRLSMEDDPAIDVKSGTT